MHGQGSLRAQRVKESNDPDFIISMMVEQLSSAEVQEAGCATLVPISVTETRAVAARGGIEAVVRAMGAHGSRETLQENGTRVLRNLATLEENRALVAAKGGIEAVVKAMGANGSYAPLQENGCIFLNIIALSDPRLQAQVQPCDCIRASRLP